MMTRMNASPSVSGTNRKWYSAVTANCSRDRSTSCSVSMGAPGCGMRWGGRGGLEQPIGDAGGIGGHRVAGEEGVENRGDQHELDGDGCGDFLGEAVLQECGKGLFHGRSSLSQGSCQAKGRQTGQICRVNSKA